VVARRPHPTVCAWQGHASYNDVSASLEDC